MLYTVRVKKLERNLFIKKMKMWEGGMKNRINGNIKFGGQICIKL